MELNYQDSSSLQGGWLTESKPDFQQGAKGLNSLPPVSFTSGPASSIYDEHLDEWMEVHETLGYNGLEAFDDVIISKEEFKPDIFETFDNLQENASIASMFDFDNYRVTSKPAETPYESLICSKVDTETPKSNVTIKLKRITVPKKIAKFPNEYSISDYEIANTPQQMDGSPFYEISCESGQANDMFSYDTAFDISNCSDIIKTVDITTDTILNEDSFTFEDPNFDTFINSGNSSPNLTLKEALSLKNADSIIENYLSSNSQSRESSPFSSPLYENLSGLSPFCQSPLPERWSNSPPLTEVPEEIFSPSTSTHYYSEGVPSPSNSDYYSRESTTPGPFSAGGVESPSPRKPSKLRKQREKMSPESRYLRKKEQNKQAALRYRVKKKLEDEILLKSFQEEEETNAKLEKEHDNLVQEIKFMKKLMRETFIAKKLVLPNAFD